MTQFIFAFVTENFAVVALSSGLTLVLSAFNFIEWCINKNFSQNELVFDYYIMVELDKHDQFDDDLAKIMRYSKCTNRLKSKVLNIIKENTSYAELEAYYIEMTGTGCNIYMIHQLSQNTKIKTDSAGSIPVFDPRISMDEATIVDSIYDGKLDAIEVEIGKLWHLVGNISVSLYNHDYPDQTTLKMAMEQQINTRSQQIELGNQKDDRYDNESGVALPINNE